MKAMAKGPALAWLEVGLFVSLFARRQKAEGSRQKAVGKKQKAVKQRAVSGE